MSSRIVLSTFGSLGDIHPMMALARELQGRGHKAIIATSELYRTKIQAEGIGFHALRPDLAPPGESREMISKVMDARTGSEYLFREILMPALRNSFADLCEVARTADLLISHPAVPAAPLVGEVLKMKWMSVALAPISIWSVYDPPVLAPLPVLSKWRGSNASVSVQRAVKRLAERISSPWIAPLLEFRQQLGLDRCGHPLFEGQHSPHGVLALFSKVLAQPQPDWPKHTHLCGFAFYDKRGQIGDTRQEDLEEQRNWIDSGEQPIVFTLGSSAVFDARDFYEQSTLAARQIGRRALLLIGDESNRPQSLPHNNDQIAAYHYAPFGEVFKSAAAVVHQGGAGTTGQVLRSGAPSLVMPYSHDQPDHAARLERLGIARSITRRKYSTNRAVRELETILNDRIYKLRAEEIATEVREENGPVAAVDAMEKLL